jgi:lipoprotein-anchoring transpeptidase ErfK/SrfK
MTSTSWTRATRRQLPLTVSVVALVALAITLSSCGDGGSPAVTSGHSKVPRVSTESAPRVPTGSTLLASFPLSVQGYIRPGGAKGAVIPPTWHGARSILPVIATRRGWVDVRLAQRPNESTAWAPIQDVTLTTTPYKILVDLTTRHLSLFKNNRIVYGAPAGVGMAAYPTPTGHFFVAFFATPPSSGYGPFVMVSSAHSNTISDWESSGDALMAIHGPLGADAEIGTTGANVSHGCVRLHISDLVHLRVVPAGSPIDVIE